MEFSFDYKDWHNELGKSKEECKLFERIKEKISDFEKKEFKDKDTTYEYYFSCLYGVSFSFTNNFFSSAFLYGKYDKKFSQYKGFLPYGINFDMTNSDIVSFLGEPNTKAGGGSVPIGISYERLGIEITFLSPVWDLQNNKISFICCFPPKKTEDNIICGVCGKKCSQFCAGCQLIAYCSKDCQKVHWKFHKSYCGKYSENKSEK